MTPPPAREDTAPADAARDPLLSAERLIGTILRHDRKQNSYKLALIRSLNDAALAFRDMAREPRDVAVPRRQPAASGAAYYWPFADPVAPILQAQRRATSGGGKAQDVAFRPPLQGLRLAWERVAGGSVNSLGRLPHPSYHSNLR